MPDMALQELALLILLGVLALCVAVLVTADANLADRWLISAFIGSALVFMCVFWMAYLAARNTALPFEWIHPFVTFANVRHFSQFQAYTLPLLVAPIASVVLPPRWRVAAFLVSAHWWALQFAVGTRAVWLASACSAALLLLLLRRDALAYLKWMSFSVAGGAVAYLALDTLLLVDAPGLTEIGRRGFDASKRGELWSSALALVREAPVLGVGPMHFSFRNFEWAAHPHNALLQVAAEYGLPAAMLVSGLVACLLRSCVRCARSADTEQDRLLNISLLMSLLMGLLDALVSGNTLMPVSQMVLSILIGWVMGRNRQIICNQPARVSPSTSLAVTAIIFASVFAVGQGALAYYEYWDARQFMVPSGVSHPRYWEEGHWPAIAPTTGFAADPDRLG